MTTRFSRRNQMQPALTGAAPRGRRPVLFLVAMAVALVLSACGTPEIQALTYNPPPWQDGEVSIYAITDEDDYAGTARYDITRTDDGWTVRREIVARGDNEIVTVTTTGDTLRPAASTMERTNSQGTESVNTTYSGSQVDMELTTSREVTTYQRETIPSDARDQRTVLMMLRLLPLEGRYAARFNSYLPVADLLDRVTLSVREREEVTVPAGTFDAWRVNLDTGDSEVDAWIGVDAPYPLVKYVDSRSRGTFELMEFVPGE
jgi:hypothetical protein